MEQVRIFQDWHEMKMAVMFSTIVVVVMNILEWISPKIASISGNVHFLMFWACVMIVALDTFLGVRVAHKRHIEGRGEKPESKKARQMLSEKFAGYGVAITFGGVVQIIFMNTGIDNKIFGIPIDPVWAAWAFIIYVEGWSYRENLRELEWKFPPIINQILNSIFKKK